MMSGGNLQKLLLGREIAAKPKLMIVLYPVRGLDIGAIEAVHKLLLQLKEEQTAIILVSEELEEIAKLADRVGVMFAGQILGEFPVSEMDTEKIGALWRVLPKREVRAYEAGNGKTSGTQSADALAGAGGGSFRCSGFLRYLFCSDGARSF